MEAARLKAELDSISPGNVPKKGSCQKRQAEAAAAECLFCSQGAQLPAAQRS